MQCLRWSLGKEKPKQDTWEDRSAHWAVPWSWRVTALTLPRMIFLAISTHRPITSTLEVWRCFIASQPSTYLSAKNSRLGPPATLHLSSQIPLTADKSKGLHLCSFPCFLTAPKINTEFQGRENSNGNWPYGKAEVLLDHYHQQPLWTPFRLSVRGKYSHYLTLGLFQP